MANETIWDALLAAQAEMPNPALDSVAQVGSRHYKYASLGAVLAAVKPALNKHGIVLLQYLQGETLSTGIVWKGFKEILDVRRVDLSGTSQQQGSAETYAKRYALCTVFCIVGEEDDDGAAASERKGGRGADSKNTAKDSGKGGTKPETASKGRFTRISELKEEALSLGINEEGIRSWLAAYHPTPMKDMSDIEIKAIEEYLKQLIEDMRSMQ